ncbi:MAG: EAL domain-containing protein [Enterobacterales bacterium]|nr:EAL domain-containing protein [Enterobacterales bacterium]
MNNKKTKNHLLLVNSLQDRLKSLHQLLVQTIDFKISTADSAEQAIKLLKKHQISLVISNINLGGFDGWRLARLVRSGVLNCASDIPFIIVANTWCEHIANTTAREFGINLVLPYTQKEKLIEIIQSGQLNPLKDMVKTPMLVIEDNPDTQDLLKRILKNQFKIDSAVDGQQGIDLWRKGQYDLVLLDVMLPSVSGSKILDIIIKEKPEQSVVIMTANHTMDLAEELMLAGAADFVTKPFRAEQLRRVCSTAARRDDYMISNKQFATKVHSLEQSRTEYKNILNAHQQLLDQLGSVVIRLTENGEISFLNKAWEKLTGYTVHECQRKSLLEFVERSNIPGNYISDELNIILSGGTRSHHFEFRLKNRFEEELWVEARFEVTLSTDKKQTDISGTIDNVTARKKAQRDLEFLAMHDGLTGLFNRHYFETELKQFSATAQRGNGPHSLLYIDLDHFKVINDTLGHFHGDVVLRNISSLIQSRLRDSDILCRIGGDEFALLLPNTDQESAYKTAEAICQLLDDYQCTIENQTFKVNCSIGISKIDGNHSSYQECLKHADIALYVAKKQGRNTAHIYDSDDPQSKELQASLEWSSKIQKAVTSDDLLLYFQPIVEIATKKTAYYEALVRLNLNGKIIGPNQFIPALEREGDMALLDRQVIRKAVEYLSLYPALNKISVNLSAQGFSDARLVPVIKDTLSQYKVDAKRIIFELTESASLSNINSTRSIVSQLSALGCEFSIDDFGTGFSTFNYLKQLPAQSVKIDGSFVVDLANNAVDLALVKAIYEVATALNKKTVAEFVENEETLVILGKIGVTYAQGYHLSRPKPINELF